MMLPHTDDAAVLRQTDHAVIITVRRQRFRPRSLGSCLMKSNKADGAWLADRRLGAQAPTSVASEGNGPDLKQPGPLRQDGSFGGSGSAPSGHAHSCKLFCRIETSSKAELIRHDQTCSIRA